MKKEKGTKTKVSHEYRRVCSECDKQIKGAEYLSDTGWICGDCFDIEMIEENESY